MVVFVLGYALLILASTNPQYDKRLVIELQVQYMKTPSSEHSDHAVYTNCYACQNKNINFGRKFEFRS